MKGCLMGKRGDFTGRTVITPDPTIGNNELRVPIKIAMNLTVPEITRKDNIDKLKQLIRNGRDKYPGANFVFKKNCCNFTKENRTDFLGQSFTFLFASPKVFYSFFGGFFIY